MPTDDSLLSRLLRLSTYAQAATAAYALSTVPLNATWGGNPIFQRYLCVEHTPLTLYVLGSLRDLHFEISTGRRPQFSITIEFLRNGDEDSLAKLLRRARPRRGEQ